MNAQDLLTIAENWLYAGAAVSAMFLTVGIDRIDESARGAYLFRPLLIPGVLLIWPLVLWRWGVLELDADSWRHRHLPERGAHAPLWCLFAVLIPLVLFAGLALRQERPDGAAPVRLEAAR